ncbi:MAG TPA: antitermination protein NusG [Acidimicrobiia bacterium]|nr:antitermination protein NusG [Acidimicrobiia bacterium]HIL46343.1 antitermination protein NusG [Acidimicrobiia bacterium]
MELFDPWFGTGGGGEALGRYAHYLAGITWIGLLYFFNFIQGAAFGEMGDAARGEALRKITWRTLWWFRWAAALTWVSGIWILFHQDRLFDNMDYWKTAPGMGIAFGVLLGTTMAANVWMIIWPAQQIAIGSSVSVANGGEADAEAPAAGKRAARASRVNTLFSIPLVFFMMWPNHFGGNFANPEGGTRAIIWAIFAIMWIGMELSAVGKIGGYDGALNRIVLDKHQDTIKYGLAITAVLYLLFEIL